MPNVIMDLHILAEEAVARSDDLLKLVRDWRPTNLVWLVCSTRNYKLLKMFILQAFENAFLIASYVETLRCVP